MLFKNIALNKVVAASAILAMMNPTNAAPTRGMRAESLEMESRDVPAVASVQDEISSLIGDASSGEDGDIAKILAQSLAPTDSVHGCVQAKDDMKLRVLISNASDGDEIRLCPGTIHFYSEIVLTESITISCVGPKNLCILDGNGITRHFVSTIGGKTFAFIDLTFINGLANDVSDFGPFGGSLLLLGSATILTGCVFKNNHAMSSSKSAVAGGAIFAQEGETVVNNCLFLDNVSNTNVGSRSALGGAINSLSANLKVIGSIFKNNKALQVDTTSGDGGGGAIGAFDSDVLVLSSVFELNKASNDGGAARFLEANVDWYNNKDILFGNDADEDCDGVAVGINPPDCFSVGDNFSFDFS